MSPSELMQTADALNAEERVFLAAHLKHLSRAEDLASSLSDGCPSFMTRS
jgi:hypothetical protein